MPDFSKIWATNSPLTPYTFADADYLTGWDFVGSAPPTKNEFDAWFKLTDEKLQWLYNQVQSVASLIYPVGSVYISLTSTDPSLLFGGTWSRLKDTFLLANGDTYPANSTGGSATKTITVSNLPAHNHTVNSAGAHTHTATTASNGAHTHSATAASNGSHTHSASTASNGAHTHKVSGETESAGNHSHTRGTMNITGTFGTGSSTPSLYRNDTSGAFANVGTNGNRYAGATTNNDRTSKIEFDASTNWTGATNSTGAHTHALKAANVTAESAGAHTHTVTVASNGAHTHTLSVVSNGAHTHTLTTASSGAHTHTTNNTGGGTALNILPPYTTVYMWKRTA